MTFFRANIDELQAYVPGEQPRDLSKYVKLNTNENPYPPSPVVEHAVRQFDAEKLRTYPDPVFSKLRRLASQVYKLPAENIFVGNGSDEILSLIMRIAVDPGDKVAYPYPTYVLYKTLAEIAGGRPVEVELQENFALSEDFPASAGKVSLFARPNSPTGNLFHQEIIEKTLENRAGIVVVDEAYGEFSGASMIELAPKYDNLVVLRTLSKSYSLAGLRVGFSFAGAAITEALYKVKDSYNLDVFSQAIAYAALSDVGYMKSNAAQIIETRRRSRERLAARGFHVYPSAANFVFAEHKELDGRTVYEELKSRKVLVRYFDQPRLRGGVRITIGTPEQMLRLDEALGEIV